MILFWIFLYVLGVPVAAGVIRHTGIEGHRFDVDEVADVMVIMVLAFLWPATAIMGLCLWFTHWALWR